MKCQIANSVLKCGHKLSSRVSGLYHLFFNLGLFVLPIDSGQSLPLFLSWLVVVRIWQRRNLFLKILFNNFSIECSFFLGIKIQHSWIRSRMDQSINTPPFLLDGIHLIWSFRKSWWTWHINILDLRTTGGSRNRKPLKPEKMNVWHQKQCKICKTKQNKLIFLFNNLLILKTNCDGGWWTICKIMGPMKLKLNT